MPRIGFYSHDTMGLGHVRRNLLLAEAVTRHDPSTTALLISGVHIGAAFGMPPNVDCVTLPALEKSGADGTYGARHLAVPLTRVVHLRARTMQAALVAFDPDVLVIDNVPTGAVGEAEPALAALKARGRTRLVLGLRDVLDEPDVVAREWRRAGYHESIERYFDEVWVYGDPAVYDVARECAFPASTASKIEYVGYLDRRRAPERKPTDEPAPPRPFALCMAGGGQDGADLALAFAQARSPTLSRVIIGGPFLPEATQRSLREIAAGQPDLHFVDFSPDTASVIEQASRLVTMGGYNTVCESLAYGKPMLIVPRESPRREQAIRAERLQAFGLCQVLPPSRLSADALREWLVKPAPAPSIAGIRFTALQRVPELVERLLRARTGDCAAPVRRRLLAS